MIQIENLTAGYGKTKVLRGVSLNIEQRQIVSIIGSNGAGKTTLLNTISGLVPQSGGRITFMDKPLKAKAHSIVRMGIVQVPEGRKVFSGLTVHENLKMGAFSISDVARNKRRCEEMYELFPVLRQRQKQLAATLSGGEQQMLAIARGLMAEPKLLLLDEPSLGLAPKIVENVFQIIKDIREKGITVLLVEQNANKALRISDCAFVLENGKIALSGVGAELAMDERIKSAYLGAKKA